MRDWIESFDCQLDVRPPLTDQQLGAVPAKRGVLALVAEADRPITLLVAADIRARLRTRLSEPLEGRRSRAVDLRAITTKVLWKLTHSHFRSDLAYLELAKGMWPGTYSELLAWKGAWFVHVDPDQEHPRFSRTRDLVGAGSDRPGRFLGPFPDGRSANRFMDVIRDAFRLCRHGESMRHWPNARPCSYAEMGRCLSPCDGTVSMSEYRSAVAAAAEFAAGSRAVLKAKLAEEMAAAAGLLAFEQAASLKACIERLGELDKPCYQHVAPLDAFRYVLVHRGRRGSGEVLLVNLGSVTPGGRVDYPLQARQLDRICRRMDKLAGKKVEIGLAEAQRIGLVAHYLWSSPQRRGLMLRWTDGLTPTELGEAIDSSKDRLALRSAKQASRRRRQSSRPADAASK